MYKKSFILKYLPLGLLLISINSHGQSLSLGNTSFWWGVQLFILLLFYIIKNNYTSLIHRKRLNLLALYIYYVFLQFIIGAFISIGYWDWKALISNTMCLFIPMIAFASNSKSFLKHLFTRFIHSDEMVKFVFLI